MAYACSYMSRAEIGVLLAGVHGVSGGPLIDEALVAVANRNDFLG